MGYFSKWGDFNLRLIPPTSVVGLRYYNLVKPRCTVNQEIAQQGLGENSNFTKWEDKSESG